MKNMNKDDISIGDRVKIIHSPYYSVKSGTVAKVISIKFHQYPKSWWCFILDNPGRCHTFKFDEIIKELG